jgi:hypothetical protein
MTAGCDPSNQSDTRSDNPKQRLAYVTHERLQLLALVGAFAKAKEAIVSAAK